MDVTESKAYTPSSFQRQTRLLKNELSKLGISISTDETSRISFLSRRKYDRYDHFSPGESFDARLLKWLSNFDRDERQTALEIVKCLKFVSVYEIKELAIQTFETIKKTILSEQNNPTEYWYNYLRLRNIELEDGLSKSVFVASVDDANFSFFRRYASRYNCFEKDNFVEYYKRDKESLDELPEHNRIFLIDQLAGSGTTALRNENGKWEGKIPRFQEIWEDHIKECSIYYCPYLLSSVAERNLKERLDEYRKEKKLKIEIVPTCKIPISPCLANKSGTDIDENKPVSKLCRKYYDRFKEDIHIKKAGPAYYGYGRAGLTLILQPNCPNNSIYMLWHDYNDWYPLFPRVTHHRVV